MTSDRFWKSTPQMCFQVLWPEPGPVLSPEVYHKFHRQGSGVQQKNTAATATATAAETICLYSTQSLPTLPTVLLSSLTAVWDCGVLAAVVHVSCSRDEQRFFLTPHLQIFFTCQTCSLQLIMSHVTSLEDVYQTSSSKTPQHLHTQWPGVPL